MNLTIDTASVVGGEGHRNNSKSNDVLQPPQIPKFPLSSPITDEIEHWPSSGESHEGGNVPKLVGSATGRGSGGLNPSSNSPLSKSEFEKVLYANLMQAKNNKRQDANKQTYTNSKRESGITKMKKSQRPAGLQLLTTFGKKDNATAADTKGDGNDGKFLDLSDLKSIASAREKERSRENSQPRAAPDSEDYDYYASSQPPRSSGLSPSDRPIVIGLTVPYTDPTTIRGTTGETVDSASSRTPATPSIVVTPAKESPPWSVHMSNSPEMMFHHHQPHPRVASSVYSQPSPRLLSDEHIPPVPAIPAFHSIAQQHNNSTEQIFAPSTSTEQRPVSTSTEFEVEEKQIEIKSGDEGMNHTKRKILHKLSVNTTDANRSPSQGWWTYLLSPLLSRSNTTSSRRTAAAGLSPEQQRGGPLSATSYATLSPPSLLSKAIISTTEDAASSTSSTTSADSSHWWDEKKLSILQEPQPQPEKPAEATTTRDISEKSHFSPDTPESSVQNTRGVSVFHPNFELHGAAAEYYQASAHDLYHPGDPYFECVNHVCSMTSAKKRAEIEASVAAAEKDLQEGREVDEKNAMAIIAVFGYAAQQQQGEENPFFVMIETTTREAQKEVGFVEEADDGKQSGDDGVDKEESSRELVSVDSEDEEEDEEERAMEEPVERGPARSPSPLSSPVLRSLRESPRVPTVRSAPSPPPVYREPPLPPFPPPAPLDQASMSHDYDREVAPEPVPAPEQAPARAPAPPPVAPPAYPPQPEHTPMPPVAPATTYPPEPIHMPMPMPEPAPAPPPEPVPRQMPEPEVRPLPMPMPPSPPAPEQSRELEEQHLDMPSPTMPPPRSEARGPANIPRGYEWEPTPIQIQIHMPYGYGQPKPATQQHPSLLDASLESDVGDGAGDDKLKDLEEGVRDQPQQRIHMPAPPLQTRNDEIRGGGRNVLRKQPPPARTAAAPLSDTSVNDMSRDVQEPGSRRELEVNEMPPPRSEARGRGVAPGQDWWESAAAETTKSQPRAAPLIDVSDDMSRDVGEPGRGEREQIEALQRRNEDRIPRGYEFEPRTRSSPRVAPLIDASVDDASRSVQEPVRGELERTETSQRRDEARIPRGYGFEPRTRSPPRAAAPLTDTSMYDRSREVGEAAREELEMPPRNEARGRRTSPSQDWWESAPTRTTRSPPRQERTPSPPIPRPNTPPRAQSPALYSTSRDIKEDSASAAAEVTRPAPSFHRPGRFAASRRSPSPSPPRDRSRSPDELSDTESVLPSYSAAARHRAVSPGLQRAMAVGGAGGIAMSEVNSHQQTTERDTSVNFFDQQQNLPRPAGNQFVTPADLRSREDNEIRRRRLENEDNATQKVGSLWRGRACFPEKGCFGRKKGPEGRKKRRWYCGIILFCMAVIILSVSLATTLTHKNGDSTTVQSEWVNLTDYPPMPTGIMTVAGPAIAIERSSCIAPTQAWSCALPKGQQQADNAGGYAADQPNFRFEIRYNNETNSTSSTSSTTTATTSATATATGSNSTSSLAFRRSLYELLLSKRDDSSWTPSPSVPRLVDQIFIGNTTDNITSPYQGEDTPFYITILSPIDTTNATTNAKVKRDGTSTSTSQSSSGTSAGTSATTAGTATGTQTSTGTGTNTGTATSSTSTGTSTATSTNTATDTGSSASTGTATTTSAESGTSTSSSDFNENSIIPAPDEASDGTAATATLYPTPISQPIKLYNRGLATEHYGFYTYYDKSIFLASDGTVTGDRTDNNSNDTDGGSTEAEASARCTFSQTRFLIRIWTQPQNVSGMVITASSNSTSANTTTTTASTSSSSSANDFVSPGSFPYPVSITIDRHGGLATKKLAYCYGIEQESSGTFYNLTDPKLQNEDRSAGGTIVNPSPDYLVLAEAIVDGVPADEIKPVDGGTGGCMCEWRNWEEEVTIS